MTVHWSTIPGRTTNRFEYKHLHIIGDKHDLAYMKSEGRRILQERMGVIPIPNRVALYGNTPTTRNTLVVTNEAGLQKMQAWIEHNVRRNGHYVIPVGVGVIVNSELTAAGYTDEARVGGEIRASIRYSTAGAGAGATHVMEVYHMQGVATPGDDYDANDFQMAKGGVSFDIMDPARPGMPLPGRLAHLARRP